MDENDKEVIGCLFLTRRRLPFYTRLHRMFMGRVVRGEGQGADATFKQRGVAGRMVCGCHVSSRHGGRFVVCEFLLLCKMLVVM